MAQKKERNESGGGGGGKSLPNFTLFAFPFRQGTKVREYLVTVSIIQRPERMKLTIFPFFQFYNRRAAQESDEEAEIRPRSVNELRSRQPKLKNLRANFTEANI